MALPNESEVLDSIQDLSRSRPLFIVLIYQLCFLFLKVHWLVKSRLLIIRKHFSRNRQGFSG